MDKKRCLVVNLIGGPGCGKSTTTAGLFYELKKKGYNCEMSLEFAKDKVYEESFRTMDDQIYIFGKQFHKLWRLKDKVDIIITDSPLVISLYYNKEESKHFDNFVVEQYNKFNNLLYFIDRGDIEFQESGRLHNKKQSIEIDNRLKTILTEKGVEFKTVNTCDALDSILKDIEKTLKEEEENEHYHRGLLNIPFMDNRAFTTVHYDWSGDDEIKSTDVCVHDWFFGTHTEGGEYEPESVLEYYPVKISSVNHYEVSTSDGEIYGFEDLRPIILTQDILTENLKGISDDAYENIVDITKNFTTIKYVHQLQRLLSLFGEKERAENFKIPENSQLIFKNS